MVFKYPKFQQLYPPSRNVANVTWKTLSQYVLSLIFTLTVWSNDQSATRLLEILRRRQQRPTSDKKDKHFETKAKSNDQLAGKDS